MCSTSICELSFSACYCVNLCVRIYLFVFIFSVLLENFIKKMPAAKFIYGIETLWSERQIEYPLKATRLEAIFIL